MQLAILTGLGLLLVGIVVPINSCWAKVDKAIHWLGLLVVDIHLLGFMKVKKKQLNFLR